MGSMNAETRCKVALRYKEMFDKDLKAVMKSECGSRDFGTALQFLAVDPVTAECDMIQNESETLTQVLFEEVNSMVSSEARSAYQEKQRAELAHTQMREEMDRVREQIRDRRRRFRIIKFCFAANICIVMLLLLLLLSSLLLLSLSSSLLLLLFSPVFNFFWNCTTRGYADASSPKSNAVRLV